MKQNNNLLNVSFVLKKNECLYSITKIQNIRKIYVDKYLFGDSETDSSVNYFVFRRNFGISGGNLRKLGTNVKRGIFTPRYIVLIT